MFINTRYGQFQLFFFGLMINCTFVFGQTKSFSDHYFKIKSQTESLKTYQILVQAHGKVKPFTSNELISNEILITFPFLNSKKLVKDQPSFIVRIILDSSQSKVDYWFKERKGEYDYYTVAVSYDLSFRLAFETQTARLATIPLSSLKHYERSFVYSYYQPIGIEQRPWERLQGQKTIQQDTEQLETNLKMAAFIGEFNELLIGFRNGH
jgi:hypothetical protein